MKFAKTYDNYWGELTSLLCLVAFAIMICAPPVSADTGTYVIDKQYADLVIKNNTDVTISYDVDFRVTGGNIPWVTMGLPNSNFDIISNGGSVKSIKPSNSGSWSGVRIDLDKTYYSGQTFNYKFSVNQKSFVKKASGNESTIQFTPVWWDNAIVKDMKVTYHVPNGMKSVKTSDKAAVFGNNESTVTWQWTNVPNGAHKTTGLTMPIAAFPVLNKPAATTSSTESSSSSSDSGIGGAFVIFFGVFVVVVIGVGLWSMVGSNSNSGSFENHFKPEPPEPPKYSPPEMFLNSALATKTARRKLTIFCINDAKIMLEETVNGVKINICYICGALFFDKGEIEDCLKSKVKEEDFNKGGAIFQKSADKQKHICPRCNGELKETTKTKGDTTVTIATCKDCGGIFLEHGEYTKLAKLFKEQKDEFTKSGKGKNKDEWLFYPYISHPVIVPVSHSSSSSSHTPYSGGSYGGGGASSCVHSSCACVSCACVACACACACAGGGAAGCSPKDKFNKLNLYDPPFESEYSKDHN